MRNMTKVPVVMQMEALECGAASLCMILAYYKKWLPLEQVRADCGVSRNGSSAKKVMAAARQYGLKADGYRMEPHHLRDIRFPAIIHWKFNHFVVLCGFKKDKAIINDPARGTVSVDIDEFDKAFTGIAMTFEPGDSFVPEGKPRSVIGFAVSRLKSAKSSLVFVMLISMLSSFLGLVLPLFNEFFMDKILTNSRFEWLVPFTISFGAVILAQFLVMAVQSLSWLRMSGHFAITANAEFVWHVLRLPMEFFSQRWAGDILQRQKSNGAIAGTLIQKLAPVLVNVLFALFYLIIMINYSFALTVIGLASVALNILAARYRASKLVNLNRRVQSMTGKLSGFTTAGIETIETIKASGAEKGFFGRWAGYYTQQYNAKIEISEFNLNIGAFITFLQQFTNACILMTGVYLILNGDFTTGMLLAFQGFLSSFLKPVNALIDLSESYVSLKADMERVEDVLNYETYKAGESPDGNPCGKLSGELVIKDLVFGYGKLDPPLIRDFSIHIKPGSTVAFVGASGCGKSTLAKLITGLYDPWEGEILFDGKKRENIDNYSFRSSVAMADQEIVIFEDTVSNNIRMWDRTIEESAVVAAVRDASLHDTIIKRKDGYNHKAIEGGRNFSGGQRQRLEIARVLAAEPSIIILDEATSALDAATEEEVMQRIKATGATCIIIAHRLSAVRDCDEIIVLDNGLVVERGDHDTLYKKGGLYNRLVSTE